MNEKLRNVLEDLDAFNEKQTEDAIYLKIHSVTKNVDTLEANAEKFAFLCRESQENQESRWGTFYGPTLAWVNQDGKENEKPALSQVTGEMLKYWELRLGVTQNSFMKSRYAGLIWDLTNKVVNQKPDYKIGITHVNELLSICDNDLFKFPTDALRKITRAYSVARGLKNKELILKCIGSALAMESKFEAEGSLGLCGFCFDLFVLGKENLLKNEQKNKIISALESRLNRISKENKPILCYSTGIPLATYYRSINKNEDMRRVVEIIGSCIETACEGVDAMLASSWHKLAHNIYLNFNQMDKAQGVAKKTAQVNLDIIKNMKSFEHKMEIPKEEFDAFLNAMVEGNLVDTLNRIAFYFIPRKDEIGKQVLDNLEQYPLGHLFSRILLDSRGRQIARIDKPEDDLEGNIINLLSETLYINSIFLHHSLRKAKEVYNISAENLLNYIIQAPIFDGPRNEILLKGLSAYLAEDHVTAIHLLIPQIEAAIRELLNLQDGNIFRPNRLGGFHLRTFDDLLRDPSVEGSLGKDITFYFRIILTDQRGWNVRNNVCHGISQPNDFNYSVADRLIHILLCIAQIKKSEN